MNNSSISRVPLPIAFLLVSLALPVELSFYIGDLLMTTFRVVLVFMALPVFFKLFKGGNFRNFDYLLFGFVFWFLLSFTYNHGLIKAIEGGGSLSLEVVVGYFIARIYISDLGKLIGTIKLLILIVTLILPFAIVESLTGEHFIHEFFRSLTGFQYYLVYEARLGFTRAYGPFSHPILLGVFSSSLVGVVWYVFSRYRFNRLLKVGILSATTLTTLSSAPLLLLLFQFFAITWNFLLKRFKWKWQLVVASFTSLYVFLLFWSPYSPLMVIMSRITLDPRTSYYRRLIWEYGTAEVLRHPYFGIGRNDWVRPSWMIHDSIDNFWLKMAMQFGIPAVIMLGGCVCLIIFKVIRVLNEGLSEDYQSACRGWIVSIISLSVIGFTVDFFGAIHVYFYFFLGIGVSLISFIEKPRSKKQVT